MSPGSAVANKVFSLMHGCVYVGGSRQKAEARPGDDMGRTEHGGSTSSFNAFPYLPEPRFSVKLLAVQSQDKQIASSLAHALYPSSGSFWLALSLKGPVNEARDPVFPAVLPTDCYFVNM